MMLEEVIDRVQIEWAALEYVLAGLPEAQWTTPGPDGWSIKDHLAHVGEWDAQLAVVLTRRSPREGFGLDEPTWQQLRAGDPGQFYDRLNAVLYERHRARSIDEVQANARRAHADALAGLHHLRDADLDVSVADFGANPNDQHTLREKIAGDTYEHYAEHTAWIKALVNAL